MRKISLLFLLLFTAASLAPAQQTLNNERGFSPEKVFQIGDLDQVNMLNGNVMVNIPLGPSYKVAGGLSYSLQLVYNSKVWDYQQTYNYPEYYREALPDRLSNAGMGWSISLGRLLEPDDPENDTDPVAWTYVGADGGVHVFYSTLHSGDSELDPADDNQYTRDGSYLRMRKLGSTLRTVEFPDGNVHSFEPYNGRWRLFQIRDRFYNAIGISYSADEKTWTITDSSDPVNPRTHRIIFSQSIYPYYDKVLERIELASFSGSLPPMTYSFGYGLVTYDKPCTQTLPIRRTVYVPALQTIFLPDGSTYGVTYQSTVDPINCEGPGAITSLTMPTLGKIEWTYRTYGLPGDGCSADADYYDRSHGVATRRFVDAAGNETGKWTYTPALSSPPADPAFHTCSNTQRPWYPAEEELRNTVTTPLNDQTVYYFSVFNRIFDSEHGFSGYDHGLPFTRFQTDATGTRFLSNQAYDCDAAGLNCVLKRSTYVRYERDQHALYCTAEDAFSYDCENINRRMASSRTVYHDDAGRYADTNHSNFDGLGHYRATATDGNFTTGNVKSTDKSYNPTRGRYEIDQATNTPVAGVHTFSMLVPTDPWVLETYSSEKVTEGTNVAYVESCFEAGTGFLQRRRNLAGNGTAQGVNDVLAVFGRDTKGNLTSEKYYGGGNQTLATGVDSCTMTLPTTTQYWIDHGYQYGVRNSSQFKDASGNATGTLAFKSLDQDIDRNTGLVSVSRDPAGIATNYEYDVMGRVITAKPQSTPGAAWTQYTYFKAVSSTSPARLEIRQCTPANQTTCTAASQKQYEYDSYGRMVKEKTLLADSTWNKRVTTFDAAGNKASVSQTQADSTPDASLKKTSYSGYDPFGRPGTETPPDGSGHNITYSYAGVRTRTKNTKIGTGTLDVNGNIPETTVAVTEIYDRQGRLWRLNEPSSSTGTNVTTEYSYDEGNRIGVVKTTAPEGTQFRYFDYDAIGQLVSETQPEKGNQQIKYLKYDPLGKPGRIQDTATGPIDLTLSYDRAGRITQVRETGGGARTLKQFTYADPATSCGYCLGKLRQGTRYNYVLAGTTPFTVAITETYTYGGPLGAVSQRDTSTRTNGAATGEDFTQTFAYNSLGQVNSLGYPQCTHTDCTSDGAASPRTVAINYTNGWLTKIPGFVDTAITYHANGMFNQIVHSNGVTDVQAIDTTNWMARPQSISTSGALANWSTGTYKYDGAGNITKIGTDWFRYDKVSRLIGSAVHDGLTGGGNEKQQSYTYDTYGNITQIATTAGGVTTTRATPVAWDTNRLTGGTYDGAGNLTGWNGASFSYDSFSKAWHMVNGTQDWLYLYTVDDERAWSFNIGANTSRWTIRDLGGAVLREYQNNASVWSVVNDYIYRSGQLVAAVTPGQQPLHFHVDHLGTPRLITNSLKQQVAYHVYYPYGEEATAFNQDTQRLKFTGHERDLASLTSAADDVDSMHARFYSPLTARFLSVDPVRGTPDLPQSWNLYAYVRGNPVTLTDPTGKEDTKRFFDDWDFSFNGIKNQIKKFFTGVNPPQRADENDPNVQALMDGDVGGNPNILPRNQVGIVQEGMNEGAAIMTAGVVVVGMAVASDALIGRLLGFLRPAGQWLGRIGSGNRIREVSGGLAEAERVFAQLSQGGRVIENTTYPGTLVELEGVGTVGLRPVSKSGPPTIDLMVRGVDIRKIKFLE
ncbi:MAG: RHS repeat domain-containing protein [Thermoanaerobaculia bacterium]